MIIVLNLIDPHKVVKVIQAIIYSKFNGKEILGIKARGNYENIRLPEFLIPNRH